MSGELRGRGARRGSRLRSLAGSTALLVRRRARRDAPLLASWIALLCLVSLLALAVPRLVLDTVDRGARAAVAEAGSSGDLVVSTKVGDPHVSAEFVTLDQVSELAGLLPGNLPPRIASVANRPTVSVLSPSIPMARPMGSPVAPQVEAQFALLGPDQKRALTLVDGRLPAAPASGAGIEVAVSEKTAQLAALGVGTILDAAAPAAVRGGPATTVTVVVVGVVASTEPEPATNARCRVEWCDVPKFWTPQLQKSRAGVQTAALTVLTSADGIAAALPLFLDPFDAALRISLRPGGFTGSLVSKVVAETDTLGVNSTTLSGGSPATVEARTDFPDALRSFDDQAAASVAQMSLMIAGLFGTVVAVMLLLGGLLVRRRSSDLVLERARGSSLGSVAVRGLTESLALTVVGVGLGVALSALLSPGAVPDPLPIAVVAGVALIAPPVQAVLVARRAWSGRRQAANRRDRQQLVVRARSRRIVLELLVVLLAVAALVSVRSRGLVDAKTDGTDPLLAAAPLLLALAVTIVVLRVQPLAVRALTALASLSRGAGGLLGAAHAQRAIAVLPLLASTLAVALVVGGSLVVQTVSAGQEDAAWQRVGADARVGGAITSADVDRVRRARGVEAAAALLSRSSVGLDSGASTASATVIAVDSGFAAVAALLPEGLAPGQAALKDLAAAAATGDTLPVLLDRRLASRFAANDLDMLFGDENVALRVVGTFDGGPDGYLDGPFVYVDLAALAERVPAAATSLLVVGPGASAAAHSVTDATEVVTRDGWLKDRRARPLVQGVERMTQLAVSAVALLGAIALITTVAAGSRSRSRSLSLLRTLGVRRRFGWVLALAELAPLVGAALVGGAAAGAAILVVVGPALGLSILAGGIGEPPLCADALTFVVIVAASLALCVVAIVVDLVAHRRDRLGEVLRVGETE